MRTADDEGFVVIAVVFCATIAWNLVVPYALAVKATRAPSQPVPGISLTPFVELALLAAATLLSLVGSLPWLALQVALTGGAMIAASYVHMFVAGAIAGYLRHRRIVRNNKG